MDPIINCIIGACCPPEVREKALAQLLCHDARSPLLSAPEQAAHVAKYLLQVFDLAPAGTLVSLVQEVGRLANGEKYSGQ